MTAVDTNVLVRFLTEDDAPQAALAKSLFEAEQIWVCKTVLLETGWVLRSLYGFEKDAIREAFLKLLGLGNVNTEDEVDVVDALAYMAHGMELADAMHLASRPAGATFTSFDRSFVRRAKRAAVRDVVEPA